MNKVYADNSTSSHYTTRFFMCSAVEYAGTTQKMNFISQNKETVIKRLHVTKCVFELFFNHPFTVLGIIVIVQMLFHFVSNLEYKNY